MTGEAYGLIRQYTVLDHKGDVFCQAYTYASALLWAQDALKDDLVLGYTITDELVVSSQSHNFYLDKRTGVNKFYI
tara:strand:+ start:1707 stop:1934 length:228 start_codon:yes stop_codon:yes gene_type:complete